MEEEEQQDDLKTDDNREDVPMDQTMALATTLMSTKARGRDQNRSMRKKFNLDPTAAGVLNSGRALVTQGRFKKVRFDMDNTQIIEFRVSKKMKKINGKNWLDYVDVAKIGNTNILNYVDVTEVYSPIRVNGHAANMGLKPRDSMDLVTGWDFSREDHRRMAKKRIEETKPNLLIGSPECRMFSALQILSPWSAEKESRRKDAEAHVNFVCELYKQQIQENRWFLHEHPVGATSWRLKSVQNIMKMAGVQCAIADQCRYGLTTEVNGKRKPARKRTRFMSNAGEVLAQLDKKCDGRHDHEPLLNGRAGPAAVYPAELCKAICKGMKRQMEFKRQKVQPILKLTVKDTVSERPELEEDNAQGLMQEAWDDTSGKELDVKRVREARRLEMQYVKEKKVWRKMPRATAIAMGYKIVGTRWLDINKGDEDSPEYRSRLVGKEFNDGFEEGLFASTPPLEALRWLLSEAATVGEEESADSWAAGPQGIGSAKGSGRNGQTDSWAAGPSGSGSARRSGKKKMNDEKVILIADVSRAFFEAPMRRKVAVVLPQEALEGEETTAYTVGVLEMSLYGTRDAATNFQREVARLMKSLGYLQSKYNASLYYHPEEEVQVLVHGDDFVAVGQRTEILKFKHQLAKRFTVKTKLVGSGAGEGEGPEARVLNRIVRCGSAGWEYEPDQRHAELITKAMGLTDAKAVKTPGEDEPHWKLEDNERLLSPAEASQYRALAARANYLALDRLDIQYATKECCRGMAQPQIRHLSMLKRLARYLLGKPRVVWRYPWQGQESIKAYSDSDWAGCKRTARSTSGGILMRGAHHIKSWSSTQKRVTLSSAEAELGALVKTACEALGLMQMAAGLGRDVQAEVFVDSTAALAVTQRKGNDKLRHVRVGQLWVQEVAENEELRFSKVLGTENPADACTKYLTSIKLETFTQMIGMEDREGRSELGLQT